MNNKYYIPTFKEASFHCPHCGVYANQLWFLGKGEGVETRNSKIIPDVYFSNCQHCKYVSIWYKENLIEPNIGGVPIPNQDLSEEIKEDYLEARDILNKSPRGSAALLRLAIEKLCIELIGKRKTLYQNIGELVKSELPPIVQQSLDYVRVVGNEAVHPGQIDLKDDKETAIRLFDLVNIIANIMITQPKEIEELYNTLPKKQKEAVERRDNKNTLN